MRCPPWAHVFGYLMPRWCYCLEKLDSLYGLEPDWRKCSLGEIFENLPQPSFQSECLCLCLLRRNRLPADASAATVRAVPITGHYLPLRASCSHNIPITISDMMRQNQPFPSYVWGNMFPLTYFDHGD